MDTSTRKPWERSRVKRFLGRYEGVQGPRWIGARVDKETYDAVWAFLRGYPKGWTPANIERFGRILKKETTLLPNGLVPFDGYKPWMEQMEEVELEMFPESTRAAAAGHDHVAHPPAGTSSPLDDEQPAGGDDGDAPEEVTGAPPTLAVGKAAQKALRTTGTAISEYSEEAIDGVLTVFRRLVNLVTFPLEVIFDVLKLDVSGYFQNSARMARALEDLASADTAEALIEKLAASVVAKAKSKSNALKRAKEAAESLRGELASVPTFEAGKIRKEGRGRQYLAALDRLRLQAKRAGQSFGGNQSDDVFTLQSKVNAFLEDLDKVYAGSVYGASKTVDITGFESFKKIRGNLAKVKYLVENTDETAIREAAKQELGLPAGSNSGPPSLVGPFATAARALASSDSTGCGRCGGTGGNAEASSDDDYSGSDSE